MKKENLNDWIKLNKKELLASYEEYLYNMLTDDYLKDVLNFKDFCKFQKDYYKNNYKEVF